MDYKKKLKRHFTNRRNIILWTLGFLVAGLLAFLWAIYAYDRPYFISAATREEVREGLVDSVAEPIKGVNLKLGEAIEGYAYKEKKENAGNSYGHFKYKEEKTNNWPTYTNEEYDFSIKYPEELEVSESTESIRIFGKEYIGYEVEHPMIYVRYFAYEGPTLVSWLESNKKEFIGDLTYEEASLNISEESIINGNKSLSFVYDSMGINKVTLIDNGDQVITFELITLGSGDTLVGAEYENITHSFK